MGKVIENKKMLACGFVGVLLGIFLLFSLQQLGQAKAVQFVHKSNKNSIQKKLPFEDDFFKTDPFESMRSFHKNFFNNTSIFDSIDSDFLVFGNRFGDLSSNKNYSISQIETDEEVVYEIALESYVVGESINVSVENNRVTISGEKEIVKGNDQKRSYFSSRTSFSQSFSVPMGVDAENVKIENANEKIILKFPKLTKSV